MRSHKAVSDNDPFGCLDRPNTPPRLGWGCERDIVLQRESKPHKGSRRWSACRPLVTWQRHRARSDLRLAHARGVSRAGRTPEPRHPTKRAAPDPGSECFPQDHRQTNRRKETKERNQPDPTTGLRTAHQPNRERNFRKPPTARQTDTDNPSPPKSHCTNRRCTRGAANREDESPPAGPHTPESRTSQTSPARQAHRSPHRDTQR